MADRCAKGHLMIGNNLYLASDGRRRCRQCLNVIRTRYYELHKDEIFRRKRKRDAERRRAQ